MVAFVSFSSLCAPNLDGSHHNQNINFYTKLEAGILNCYMKQGSLFVSFIYLFISSTGDRTYDPLLAKQILMPRS